MDEREKRQLKAIHGQLRDLLEKVQEVGRYPAEVYLGSHVEPTLRDVVTRLAKLASIEDEEDDYPHRPFGGTVATYEPKKPPKK